MALCLFLIGVSLALPGEATSDPLNIVTRNGIMSVHGLEMFFMGVGILRAMALYANGSIPKYGPRARAVCSAFSALIWIELTTASIWAGFVSGKVTIAAAVYGSLAFGELLSYYRATYDAGRTP